MHIRTSSGALMLMPCMRRMRQLVCRSMSPPQQQIWHNDMKVLGPAPIRHEHGTSTENRGQSNKRHLFDGLNDEFRISPATSEVKLCLLSDLPTCATFRNKQMFHGKTLEVVSMI